MALITSDCAPSRSWLSTIDTFNGSLKVPPPPPPPTLRSDVPSAVLAASAVLAPTRCAQWRGEIYSARCSTVAAARTLRPTLG